jgi:hypothetical protein
MGKAQGPCDPAVDQQRWEFRSLVDTLLAAPVEEVVPRLSTNVRFLLSTNTTIFMQVRGVCMASNGRVTRSKGVLLFQEMMEELDRSPPNSTVKLGEFEITVEQQRDSLERLFELTLDFIEVFVQHTKDQFQGHQAVLREIVEVAQNGRRRQPASTCLRLRAFN